MQFADADLTAALAAPDRSPSHTIRLGGMTLGGEGDEDAYVLEGSLQSWSVERSYTTDLPPALRAFSGSAAAQLEFELSGGTGEMTAPQLYSAWAPRVPGDAVRPGQTLVHRAGVDGHDLPVFRGTVRSRTAASGSDTVKVSALDGTERLRGPAQLNNPYAGLTRQRPIASEVWCVDELLRQGGLHSCPPPRAPEADEIIDGGSGDRFPFTILYASLHGGVNSTHGQPESVPDPASYTYVCDGAPHAMALLPKVRGLKASWMPRSRVLTPSADELLVEAHVNSGLGTGDTVELKLLLERLGSGTGHITFKVDFAAGRVVVSSGTVGGGWWEFHWSWPKLAALRGAWHIGALIVPGDSVGGILPTVRPMLVAPDGTRFEGTSRTYTDPVAGQPAAELNRVELTTDLAVEGVQVTTRLGWMFTVADFADHGDRTEPVRLDLPVLPLRTIPKVSGSQWDAITEIARHTMSTAEFDERGVFRWRGYRRFEQVPVVPDLTVTSRREIAALTVSEEIDACRNYCEQPYLNWTGITAVGGTDLEFQPGGVQRIDSGRTVEVRYPISEDVFEVGPPVAYDDTAGIGGSRVRFGDDYVAGVSGGAAVKGSVIVSVRREATEMVLRFSNRGSTTVWTTTKDGKPSLVVQPVKRTADPPQHSKAAWSTESQKYYGLQQHLAQAGEWIQDGDVAQRLADALLAAGSFPVPVLSDVEVLYDPRIQLGDVVRVVDTAGAELDTLAWVVGIRTAAGPSGSVQQTLTLRGTAANGTPTGFWLANDPPVDPAVGRTRTYADLASAHPSLASLAASSYRDLKEYP